LQGIYPSDLLIPSDPTTAPQLIFYFAIETAINERFKSLAVEVTLPGNTPVRQNVLFVQLLQTIRYPLLIQSPILRAGGQIEAKIIHESGELQVGAPRIILAKSLPKPN
jgi:hypothetical protein